MPDISSLNIKTRKAVEGLLVHFLHFKDEGSGVNSLCDLGPAAMRILEHCPLEA